MSVAAPSLAPLIGRAIAGETSVSEHTTDQRIADAVIAELLVTPLRKLSLEDVARRAGLTRMTVYRRFGDRQALIEATFAREVSRFLAGVAALDDPKAPATERIATAFAAAAGLAHSHPLIAHWRATSPGDLLATVLADDAAVLAAGSAFLAAGIHDLATPGRKRKIDVQRASELLARLFAALVLMPPPSVDLTDPEQARRLARELIAPLVVPAP